MSFGNQLQRGEYKIHSRFSSAINFISGNSFVFLVNESVGAGPVNIVVSGFVPQEVDSLEIEDTCIKLNGSEFGLESGRCYNSSFDLTTCEYELFVKNLGIVERVVIEKAKEKSLSFLLVNKETLPQPPLVKGDYEETPPISMGNFEVECRRIIKAGAEQILYGDVITGVKMIKGLGPGLTPSGDDFNSGLLIAMNVVNQITAMNNGNSNVQGIPAFAGMTDKVAGMTDKMVGMTDKVAEMTIMQVYNAAKGKNLFTNSFLSCAANGYLFFKFLKLLSALMDSDVNKIINNTELVMTMGETSGADQLTGFLIGMKRFL